MSALADLRRKVALALAPSNGDGWGVHDLPVDAVTPPSFVLTWGDPWMVPGTHCYWSTRLVVVAVSNRIDIEPGVETLETLVETGLARLQGVGIPASSVSRPGPWLVGNILYHAARITIVQPVLPGGSDG